MRPTRSFRVVPADVADTGPVSASAVELADVLASMEPAKWVVSSSENLQIFRAQLSVHELLARAGVSASEWARSGATHLDVVVDDDAVSVQSQPFRFDGPGRLFVVYRRLVGRQAAFLVATVPGWSATLLTRTDVLVAAPTLPAAALALCGLAEWEPGENFEQPNPPLPAAEIIGTFMALRRAGFEDLPGAAADMAVALASSWSSTPAELVETCRNAIEHRS